MKVRIRVPEGYEMISSVHAWVYPDIQPVPELTTEDTLARRLTVDGREIPVTVTQKNTTLIVESTDKAGRKALREKIVYLLGLDIDIGVALGVMQQEDVLSSVAAAVASLRPYSADTPYEALIKAITQQQVSYRTANVLVKSLVLELSKREEDSEGGIYGFPSARAIRGLGIDGLRKMGFGFRAKYILNIADLVDAGDLDLNGLVGASYEEVYETLHPIRGIGDWTIQALCISGLHIFTVFPYSDLGIRNLLGRVFGHDERPSPAYIRKLAESWGDAGPLVLYLMMCADVLGHMGEFGR